MKSSYYLAPVIVVAFLALIALFFHGSSVFAAPAPKAPIEIKWLIAHEPVSLFDRAVIDFATEFNKDGDGTVHITVLGPKDFGATNGQLNTTPVLNALDSGQVQMATVVVGGLASTSDPELGAINLPYLFTDYPSAERVFDGPAGAQLLAGIGTHANVQGLAFTFSGGFMVIESANKQILSAGDLKGLRIGTIDGAIAQSVLASFGSTPVNMDAGAGVKANSTLLDQYDGVENPYTRITPGAGVDPKYIIETNHALFTTVIMASDSFYNSLSPKNQAALKNAAQVAAEDERADSIALGLQHKQQLLDAGTVITELPASSKAQLQAMSQPVYQKYEAEFGSGLVNEIKAEQQ